MIDILLGWLIVAYLSVMYDGFESPSEPRPVPVPVPVPVSTVSIRGTMVVVSSSSKKEPLTETGVCDVCLASHTFK
jgi:hypothetical protein